MVEGTNFFFEQISTLGISTKCAHSPLAGYLQCLMIFVKNSLCFKLVSDVFETGEQEIIQARCYFFPIPIRWLF
jgi:hypothetical protein